MWVIPEDGITQDVTECDAELRGHAKKIMLSRFHPSADYTLASAGADMTVRVWDVSSQKCVVTYDECKSFATGLEWSHNGSLLSIITKEKQICIFDPRKEGPAMTATAHEGARP